MNISKTRISKINNYIFLLASILVLSFIWINYYLRNLRLALICSLLILVSFSVVYFTIKIFRGKHKKSGDSPDLDYMKTQVIFGNQKTVMQVIEKGYGISATTADGNHIIDRTTKTDYFFLLKEAINDTDILNIFKTREFENVIVFCIDESIKIPAIKNCNIKLIGLKSIVETLSLKGLSLDQGINIEKTAKPSLKDVLCIVLCKDKAKSYFWFGVMLQFFGLLSPFHIYYIVTGTILILLSIYCRFKPEKDAK